MSAVRISGAVTDDDVVGVPAWEARLLVSTALNVADWDSARPERQTAPVVVTWSARRYLEHWASWDAGDRVGVLRDLRPYTVSIAEAPATIRGGAVEDGFVTDAAPWLDATELWGRATVTMLDALDAWRAGRQGKGGPTAHRIAEPAGAGSRGVDPPRNTRGKAQVKVGDGVLDTFLVQAEGRMA
ncbi:hypothetical protein ACWD0A_06390 [Streptomyces sp. NPDC002867]